MKPLERGNKLWEGHRMTLPEHVAALEDAWREQERFEPPSLSEDALAEMGWWIDWSYREEKAICLTIAHSWGPKKMIGFVTRIDPVERWLVLQNGSERERIPFRLILAAEEPPEDE
jgi:hypothetical protein